MATKLIALPPRDIDVFPRVQMQFVPGDTVKFPVQLQDPDPDSVDPDNPDMLPRNLTGWSGRAHVRKDTKIDTPILATFEVTGFDSTGILQVHLPPAQSALIRIKSGWDLELTDPSSAVDTILGGPVVPTLDYTHA